MYLVVPTIKAVRVNGAPAPAIDEPAKIKQDNRRILRHTERQMIKKAVQRCEFEDLDLPVFRIA